MWGMRNGLEMDGEDQAGTVAVCQAGWRPACRPRAGSSHRRLRPRAGSRRRRSPSRAAIRSAGARWRLIPKPPPPIDTTGSPTIAASAITGQAVVDPNGVIV